MNTGDEFVVFVDRRRTTVVELPGVSAVRIAFGTTWCCQTRHNEHDSLVFFAEILEFWCIILFKIMFFRGSLTVFAVSLYFYILRLRGQLCLSLSILSASSN